MNDRMATKMWGNKSSNLRKEKKYVIYRYAHCDASVTVRPTSRMTWTFFPQSPLLLSCARNRDKQGKTHGSKVAEGWLTVKIS